MPDQSLDPTHALHLLAPETRDPRLRGFSVFDPSDPHEINCGPFYCRSDEQGGLRFAFLATAHQCNSRGQLHGGLLMTFADLVIAGTAVHGFPEEAAVTVSLTSNFAAAGTIDRLITGRADVTRRTGSMGFLTATIACEDQTLLTCSAVMKRIARNRLTG